MKWTREGPLIPPVAVCWKVIFSETALDSGWAVCLSSSVTYLLNGKGEVGTVAKEMAVL